MKNSNSAHTATQGPERAMPAADWARFGVEQIAYIRPVVVNGVHAMAIHAADGTPIGAAPTADLAIAAILQHEMAPVRVH
ncbi:DUF1150 family protein [Paracraurococcus ruber]|uniref:DUF1150 family protein n=1 Tax=Paracraurococcus ruber TaxID=77675 RepID=A0ABS1CVX2_9PROT|nr:DUF1150 family protein [Paracraurococcus ruber]MBK1657859.1 hypothetical protein [Paracraurococcus ruber]TDG33541.1 DUF1150 family protein [Paracraurococcus ruber]